ncbi:hypothetical protein C8J56DRAFT_896626 [Mycena floridula]|nr:hypothetical protein C8J56DRAFT_899261 [Mycena floridula]KAJ7580001.1 hypothetical protein C8J56DRAFT_896626 [Mycena floridula]
MPASYDDFFGSLLIGSWVNTMLYTLEIVAVVTYFSKCARNDPRRILVAVIIVFLLDTAGTLGIWLDVYLYTVSHWGQVTYIKTQTWTHCFPGAVFPDSAVLALHTTKARRCILVCTYLVLNNNYTDRSNNPNVVMANIWLVFTALADIAISIALIRHLVTQEVAFQATKRLLRRIVAMTLGTGLLTSFGATAVLLSFVININSNVSTGICYCLGRVYALTMMYNLNWRSRLRDVENVESFNLSLFKTVGTAGNSPDATTATSSDRKPEAKDPELGSEVGVKESEVENKKEIEPEQGPDVDSLPP